LRIFRRSFRSKRSDREVENEFEILPEVKLSIAIVGAPTKSFAPKLNQHLKIASGIEGAPNFAYRKGARK
jgi:hypothetical protein